MTNNVVFRHLADGDVVIVDEDESIAIPVISQTSLAQENLAPEPQVQVPAASPSPKP